MCININKENKPPKNNCILQIPYNTWILFFTIYILWYKVVSFFCLNLKISITTEPIEFSFFWNLHCIAYVEPGMNLGYLESSLGMVLDYFNAFSTISRAEFLNARGVSTSNGIWSYLYEIIFNLIIEFVSIFVTWKGQLI